MKTFYMAWVVALVFLIGWARIASSQEAGKQPLRLVQTILMPGVKGRLDHMEVDVQGKRLLSQAWKTGRWKSWT